MSYFQIHFIGNFLQLFNLLSQVLTPKTILSCSRILLKYFMSRRNSILNGVPSFHLSTFLKILMFAMA